MVLSIDIGMAALTGSAFAAGALLQPLLLWFGLKGLGKIAGPKGIWAGGVAAVAVLLLHQIGALHVEEHKAILIGLFLVLAASVGAQWLWSRSRSSAAVHREQSQTMDGDGAGNRVQTTGDSSPVTIQNGVSAEQLATLLAQANAPLVKQAEQFGILKGTIIGLAKRWEGSTADTAEQALKDLEYLVGLAINVQASPNRMANEDALLREVLARAANQSSAGNYTAALAAIDSGIAEVDRRDTEQREARQRQRVTLHEEAIQIALLSGDISAAAIRVEALANAQEPSTRPAWTPAFRAHWDKYFQEGRDRGINISLELAITLAKRMLESAVTPDERGDASNILGNAQATLGELEIGSSRLQEAVLSYRKALQYRTRDRVPVAWAATQNNLGNALLRLGEKETDIARLNEAVTAFQAALEVRTPEEAPLEWATTKNNLGNALIAIGHRNGNTFWIDEAINAYRDALKVRTRDIAPLAWANTQTNLGAALRTLDDYDGNPDRLREAITAFESALQVHTRQRFPFYWAGDQTNLGNAWMRLGERERDVTLLNNAVSALRRALEVYSREQTPQLWAAANNNLGAILATVGEWQGDENRLNDAIVACYEALTIRTRESAPFDWATTQNNLGNALRALGECESGTDRLEAAVSAFHRALEVWTEEVTPHWHNVTQQNLSRAEALLAARRTAES